MNGLEYEMLPGYHGQVSCLLAPPELLIMSRIDNSKMDTGYPAYHTLFTIRGTAS